MTETQTQSSNPWKRVATVDIASSEPLTDVMAQQLAEKMARDERAQEDRDLALAIEMCAAHTTTQVGIVGDTSTTIAAAAATTTTAAAAEAAAAAAAAAVTTGAAATTTSAAAAALDDDDASLALALQLQAEEEKGSNTTTTGAGDDDDDYLMALRLQSAFDAEAMIPNGENSSAKVTVSYRNHFASDDDYNRFMYHNGQVAYGQHGDDDDDDDDDDNDNHHHDHYDRKAGGRVGADSYYGNSGKVVEGAIITKHDKEMSSRRNAEILLDDRWGGKSGDVSVSGKGKDVMIPTSAFNKLREAGRRHEQRRIRHHGGHEFDTQDGALDQRTRIIILSMINAALIDEMHGCISTGKESTVYHADGHTEDGENAEYAIKIFLTTINQFKNRREYINGDFRYRRQQKTQTSKQLVELWAKKELQNLRRLIKHGVRCPFPAHVEKHVLVLDFIGEGSIPAPKLRHAIKDMSNTRRRVCYHECIKLIRQMYQKALLVHADLSEYNLLWFKNEIYVIDVSQAIENDNPNALNYLRRDCIRITDFFVRNGIKNAMSSKQLFDFVVDPELDLEAEDDYLQAKQREIAERGGIPPNEMELAVFENESSFIPRTLWDVEDPHIEHQNCLDADTADVYHQAVAGLSAPMCEGESEGEGEGESA
eukprot:TRINITY_DN2032_c0_g4_i1.p1 TRINITY_DN2032_c0_g4~~TRINITY_DN2032_c0_g4_i1.p1  ORF type:complete len:651 (-),score=205.00 TRINITY_DN2032_c0_g4_i1:192-2144(-)